MTIRASSRTGKLKNLSFVIWTTTTWTLPGNLAICPEPGRKLRHRPQRPERRGSTLSPRPSWRSVMKAGGVEDYTVVSPPRRARVFEIHDWPHHPFLDRRRPVLFWPTMSPWTPARAASIPPRASVPTTIRPAAATISEHGRRPVDDQGRHTDDAGKYAGMTGRGIQPAVILKDMQEAGALFASEEIVHSYPHCWRCKKPIIFRATAAVVLLRRRRSRTRPAPPCDDVQLAARRGALTA